jgi:hypothetical protein
VLAILAVVLVVLVLLTPNPLADVFVAGSMLFVVILTIIGGIGAWTDRSPVVWVVGLSLGVLSVLSMVGPLLAPGALLMLAAAVTSQAARARSARREQIRAHPPETAIVRRKVFAGALAVVIGGVLVYIGAFTQELFGACGVESLACALEMTHWDAVGITLLGIFAVIVGGWLLWQQASIVRALM